MRKIIHIDMDAFFVSVEMLDRPELIHKPVAVGGSSDRRGVISTANYEARKFGIKSAMATSLALRLCPHLVILKHHFEKYREVSNKVFNIFSRYTQIIEPLSLDEAYLDVTHGSFHQGSATLLAQEIRQVIFQETGLTASAGIAPNKLLAKLASDINKPNDQFTITPHQIDSFILKVPVEKLWGVGKVTAKKFHQMGIKNCADLQKLSMHDLYLEFGKSGQNLYQFCRGIDLRNVETDWERKSLGIEETFVKDLTLFEELEVELKKLYAEFVSSLENYQDRTIKSIQVKIKYFNFKQTTIERQIPVSLDNFLKLLGDKWSQLPIPVRLIGIGVKFEETFSAPIQLPLLT